MQLEKILGKKNNIKVIKHLIKHKDWEFNITELAKDLNMNKGILSRLIKDLEKENTIKVNRKGKILLFKINKENLIIRKLIMPLFIEEETIIPNYLKKELKKVIDENIISVILYGSFASGMAKLNSDVDVMIVVKKDDMLNIRLDELKKEFLKNDLLLRVDVVTLNEFKKIYKQREPLINSIIKNHRIIVGGEITEII